MKHPAARILLASLAMLTASLGVCRAQEESAFTDNPKVLACTPRVLKKVGSVTLAMGPRHGMEMAISRKGTRDWYFVVTGGPEKPHFMTPQAFGAARRVTLSEQTTGWGPPKGQLTRIFTKPGRYVVHISDKLESEADGNICTIDYRP